MNTVLGHPILCELLYLTYEIGTVVADIAQSRAEIEGARLLVLSAALQVSHIYFNRWRNWVLTQSLRLTIIRRKVH